MWINERKLREAVLRIIDSRTCKDAAGRRPDVNSAGWTLGNIRHSINRLDERIVAVERNVRAITPKAVDELRDRLAECDRIAKGG